MKPDAVGEYCLLNDSYTFDRFIRGERNSLAAAAAITIAETPAEVFNPLFIHGKSGLGKTHLMHAVGNQIKIDSPWMNVAYITSERFTNDLVKAIHTKTTTDFRHRYRKLDVLLIDDVHFLKERAWTQEELYHTFNELYEEGKQIILSSDRPPEELSQLQDRLVSRFRWGLVVGIYEPDFHTRLTILRSKSYEMGLNLDEGVLELIAKRVRNNVRALEGALIKVSAYINLFGQLSFDSMGKLLPSQQPNPILTLEEIKIKVADHYRINVSDLAGKSRIKVVSLARQMAIYFSRELTQSSFPALGQAFGNRNHSTIMHAYKNVRDMLDAPLFQQELDALRETLFGENNQL
jgi:chromosomal replication initiator protein